MIVRSILYFIVALVCMLQIPILASNAHLYLRLKLSSRTVHSIKSMLHEVIPSLEKADNHPKVTHWRFSTTKYIFEHTLFPNYIFKLKKNPSPYELQENQALLEHASTIINDYDLSLLIIPRSYSFYFTDQQGGAWAVFMQEKIPLSYNQGTKAFLTNQRAVQELTIFIAKTAFSDIHYGNIPLTLSQEKIVLCDLEYELYDIQSTSFHDEVFVGLSNLLLAMPDELHTLIITRAQDALKLWPKTMVSALCQALDHPVKQGLSLTTLRMELAHALKKQRPFYYLKLLGLEAVKIAYELRNSASKTPMQ